MSLSLRSHYSIGIAPERAIAVRRKRGLGRVIDFKRIEECAADAVPWSAALSALERVLQRPEVTPGDLSLVLSNHFVRYLLLPWNDQITTREEFDNYARACFDNVFGAAAQAWEIRVSPGRPGAPRLASAVDRELLAALRLSAAQSRLRLVSIQPYLMAAYNRLGRHFRGGDFVFALIERGRTCLLTTAGRRWHSVRAAAATDGEKMESILERELRLLEANSSGVSQLFIHAPDCGPLALPRPGNAEQPLMRPEFLLLAPLSGFEPHADAAFSMALAA